MHYRHRLFVVSVHCCATRKPSACTGRRDACRSRSGSSRGQEDKKRAEVYTREDEIEISAPMAAGLASSDRMRVQPATYTLARVADKVQTCALLQDAVLQIKCKLASRVVEPRGHAP